MSGGTLLIVIGLVVAGIGLFDIIRKLPPIRPWQPGDGISLIELGISKVDPNFVPAGEMPWERKLDKLICWVGLIIGIGMVGLGLAYGQD